MEIPNLNTNPERIKHDYSKTWIRFGLVFLVSTLIAVILWFFETDPDWRFILAAYLYTFSLWYGNYYFSTFIYHKLPRLSDTARRLKYSLIFVFIYTLFIVTILEALLFQFEGGMKSFIGMYLFSFFVTVLISALHGSFLYFYLLRKSIEEKEAIKRMQMENELKVLSSQVNPHFLFNSLNSLMSLIHENPDLAVKFTQKLSDVYRYVLQSRNVELTSLQNELEFADNFTFLMKIRFGDNLIIHKEIQPAARNKKIPVLSMQMLIENAIKHNTISTTRPLEVTIATDQDFLVVKNNRNPKIEPEDGTGYGLENIQKRYSIFTSASVKIEETFDCFIVRIPLLSVETYESIDH